MHFSETVVNAGADFFVIRGTTVSAEHVANGDDVLDLRKNELDEPVGMGRVHHVKVSHIVPRVLDSGRAKVTSTSRTRLRRRMFQ